MNAIFRELTYSFRGLRKNPAFTVVVVLTLGLGIGANAAIFSLLDQVLVRSLPVQDPDRLVLFDGPGAFQGRTMNAMTFSYPMYKDLRDRNEVLTGLLARMPMSMTVAWKGQAERVSGELVSGNYFEVLGVRPSLGRLFNQADDRTPGAHPIAVLSHGFWQRRFGGDPSILNQTIIVNGQPLTIVGVSAPGFAGLQVGTSADVLVPVMMKPQMTPTWNDLDNRRSRWVNVMGRLAPGMRRELAATQLNVVYRQANEEELAAISNASESFRKRFLEKRLEVLEGGRGLSDLRAQFSTALIVLMCMVGVVLLIACANVANLLLARTTTRQKEISLRLALGAGRTRIVRQQFVDSLVLAVAGAAMGLVLATWTGTLLLSAMPGSETARSLSASPDVRVVGFTLTLAVLTALIFGIAPALQATRPAAAAALKEEGGALAGGGRQARLRRVLVVGQVAMSMLLLAGAGLFARSLYNLRSVDPGFSVEHMLTFAIDPTLSGYDQPRLRRLYEDMQRELTNLPGVRSVSMSEIGVLNGNQWGMTVRIDGYQAREGEDMNPNVDGVGPRFFSTMGIPLIRGREFTDADAQGAPRVAIINETMAKRYFGDSNPVGRRFGFGRDRATEIEIVGVAQNVRTQQLRDEAPRFVYIPYAQNSELTQLTFFVRATGDPSSIGTGIRRTVQRLDANLPVFDMKTMEMQVAESLFVERMVAGLSVAFGGLATLLAAIGLYGVMSYAVTRRTREIGIRMALGAERRGVLWLVLKEVAILSAIGVTIGLAAAFYATRKIEAQLYGVTPMDPATMIVAVIALLGVAMLAGFIPARRATAIDPMQALRAD